MNKRENMNGLPFVINRVYDALVLNDQLADALRMSFWDLSSKARVVGQFSNCDENLVSELLGVDGRVFGDEVVEGV